MLGRPDRRKPKCYDWLYEYLSKETRNTLKEAIINKAFLPSLESEYNGFLTRTTNWNQVCNAGLTLAALSIFDEAKEESTYIIERSTESIKLAAQGYAPDGNYTEGYQYWFYGTTFHIMMLAALESALGSDNDLHKIDGFMKTAEYILFMTSTVAQAFNYSDSGARQRPNIAMFWFAQKSNNPSLLYWEKFMLDKKEYLKSFGEDRLLPALMSFGNTPGFSHVQAPKTNMWVGKGTTPVALFHRNWGEVNAQYLGIKGGKANVPHGHMDAGSFVYDANGVRWAMDFDPENYTVIESHIKDLWNLSQNSGRWKLFRLNNKAHNTLTINNKNHLVGGTATIIDYFETSEECGAKINLSPVFGSDIKSAIRTGKLSGDDLIIEDVIETNDKSASINWRMVSQAIPTIDSENNYIRLERGGKVKYLTVESEFPVTLRQWSTTPDKEYESSNSFANLIGFESALPANRTCKFIVKLSSTKPVSGNELIRNGGFEIYEWLPVSDKVDFSNDGLWKHRKVNNMRIGTTYVNDIFYSGNRSLKLHLEAGNEFKWYYNYVYQKVKIDIKNKYEVNFWGKGNNQVQILFYTRDGKGNFFSISEVQKKELNEDWNFHTCILDIPANQTLNTKNGITSQLVSDSTILCLAIPNTSNNSPTYTLWIDDVELREVSSTHLNNVILRREPVILVKGKKIYFDIPSPTLIHIFDLAGNLAISQKIDSNQSIILHRRGFYIVKLTNFEGETTKKIVIH